MPCILIRVPGTLHAVSVGFMMDVFGVVPFLVVAAFLIALAANAIRILPEYERGVLFRLGRVKTVLLREEVVVAPPGWADLNRVGLGLRGGRTVKVWLRRAA